MNDQANRPLRNRAARTVRQQLAWVRPFLRSLAECGVVSRACRDVGIDDETVRRRRLRSPRFATALKRAKASAARKLEYEAYRRAHDGVAVPLFGKNGKRLGDWVDSNGNYCPEGTPGAVFIPAVIRRYSDTLLLRLLEVNFPRKYARNRTT